MRTTLTIRDDLYEAVRRQAFEKRQSLGEVVNELLEKGLSRPFSAPTRTLGAYAGQISVSEDFDDEMDDFTESLEAPIEP